MDELELLKKDWKKQEQGLPKLSYNEIYQMILQKSSSMVKWIFIISILEFVLWFSIDIGARLSSSYSKVEDLGMGGFSIFTMVISYSVLLYFMIKFYNNYKKIQTTDSAKVLMQNILNTRKTVRHYVWVNLTVLGAIVISTILYMLFFTDEFTKALSGGVVPVISVIIVAIIITLLFIGLLALVYRFVYGILTRRLKQNYKELEKLDL